MDGLDEDDDVEKHKNRGFVQMRFKQKQEPKKSTGHSICDQKFLHVSQTSCVVSLDGVAAPEEHFMLYDEVCEEVLQELQSEVSSLLAGLTYGR